MNIREFLLARIQEDEQRATWFDPLTATIGAGRLLAEARAKRAIVEFHEQWPVLVQEEPVLGVAEAFDINAATFHMTQRIDWLTTQEYRRRFGDEPPTTPMLRALAGVYSRHPDYREEWSG